MFIETSIRSWGTVVDGGWKRGSAITLVKPMCIIEISPQSKQLSQSWPRGQGESECDSPKVPNHNLTSSLSPHDPVKATTKIQRLWLRGRVGRTEEEGRRGGGSAELRRQTYPECREPHLAMSPFSSVHRKVTLGKRDLLDTSRERLGA